MSLTAQYHGLSCFCDVCMAESNAMTIPRGPAGEIELQRLNRKVLESDRAAHMAAVQAMNNPSMGAVISPGAVFSSGSSSLGKLTDPRMSLGLPGTTLFAGMVEVSKVENGYLVAISTELGGLPKLFIASSVAEANSLILSQMVAFRLES